MNDEALRKHLESLKYLPPELRDFHDQKDLFKLIGNRDVKVHEHGTPEIINWRQGMIYAIDHFLHFMAVHGYELRKVKGKIPRKNLQDAIEESQKAQREAVRYIVEGNYAVDR